MSYIYAYGLYINKRYAHAEHAIRMLDTLIRYVQPQFCLF